MRVAMVVNVMQSSATGASSYRLAAELVNRGHDVWIMTPARFSYEPDDRVRAFVRTVPAGNYPTGDAFLQALRNKKTAINRWITLDDLDILLLRNNPSVQSPWAQGASIHFGRIAAERGVIVLNDPSGLAKAMNKLYFQSYPEEVRPRSLITRSPGRLKAFADAEGAIVIKPLSGSGGKSVFMVRKNDRRNFDDMIKAVRRDGYVLAQEYLPAAVDGDTRLFLMNGVPLVHEGHYAAVRRVRGGEDMRSNIHAGGKLRRAVINDTMLALAEMVRPKLVEDGMFLVGLDIVGDKLMEINVFSPGGLGSAQTFEKVDFAVAVVDALERKVSYMNYYRRNFGNLDLATL